MKACDCMGWSFYSSGYSWKQFGTFYLMTSRRVWTSAELKPPCKKYPVREQFVTPVSCALFRLPERRMLSREAPGHNPQYAPVPERPASAQEFDPKASRWSCWGAVKGPYQFSAQRPFIDNSTRHPYGHTYAPL